MFTNDTNYLDQHFLIDSDVKSLFLQTCDLNNEDEVVEIGPGKGTLSKMIVPFVKKLTIIEKDVRLIPYLEQIPNVDKIYSSVLNVKIPPCTKIITSLPYSITEPFIYKMIDTKFQKLIMICGNKYALSVKNNELNKLSILTNSFFNFSYIKTILPTSFNPQPKVLSALVTLTTKDVANLTINEKIIRNLFLYRYLKVKNALKEIIVKINDLTQRESRDLVQKLNIPTQLLEKKFDELSNDEAAQVVNIIKENF